MGFYLKKFNKFIVVVITISLISTLILGNIKFVFAEDYISPNKTIEDLEKLYNERKNTERGTYTHASWQYFQNALGMAKSVLEHREEVTQADIDWAYEYLATAVLEEHDGSEVDISALEEAYHTYKDVEQGNYNNISWRIFTEALEEARKMIYEYTYIEQHIVDRALYDLEEAYEGLEEGEPDISKLEEVYNQYKDLEQGNYNKGSWTYFQQALSWLNTLLTDPFERDYLTQARIEYELEYFLDIVNRLETGEPDLTELEQLFEDFKEKYEDIDPEEYFAYSDDVDLFESIMYYVPIYLYDEREYATHYETDELIGDIKYLMSLLEYEETTEDKNNDSNDKTNENEQLEDQINDSSNSQKNEEEINKNNNTNDGDKNITATERNKNNTNNHSNNADSTNSDRSEHIALNNNSFVPKNVQNTPLGKVLPITSTEHYNMLVLGILFVIEGIFLYLYFSLLKYLRRRFNLF